MEGFTAASQSEFGCLLVGNEVAVATQRWWQLPSAELVLIPLFVRSMLNCTAQDIAVFLPVTSPKVRSQRTYFSCLLSYWRTQCARFLPHNEYYALHGLGWFKMVLLQFTSCSLMYGGGHITLSSVSFLICFEIKLCRWLMASLTQKIAKIPNYWAE